MHGVEGRVTCPAEAGSVAGARTKPQEGKNDHEHLINHLTSHFDTQ
jgi:hypothetical protein